MSTSALSTITQFYSLSQQSQFHDTLEVPVNQYEITLTYTSSSHRGDSEKGGCEKQSCGLWHFLQGKPPLGANVKVSCSSLVCTTKSNLSGKDIPSERNLQQQHQQHPEVQSTVSVRLGTLHRQTRWKTEYCCCYKFQVEITVREGDVGDSAGTVTVELSPIFRPGDILCVDLGCFFHYGVFTGGSIIHFWGGTVQLYDREGVPVVGGVAIRMPYVQECSLVRFCRRGRVLVERSAPDSIRDEIVSNAYKLKKNDICFNFMLYDCKDFAYSCYLPSSELNSYLGPVSCWKLGTKFGGDFTSFVTKKARSAREGLQSYLQSKVGIPALSQARCALSLMSTLAPLKRRKEISNFDRAVFQAVSQIDSYGSQAVWSRPLGELPPLELSNSEIITRVVETQK